MTNPCCCFFNHIVVFENVMLALNEYLRVNYTQILTRLFIRLLQIKLPEAKLHKNSLLLFFFSLNISEIVLFDDIITFSLFPFIQYY